MLDDPASPLSKAIASERHLDEGFDGNRSDLITQWYFREAGVDPLGNRRTMHALMRETVSGDLDWVIIPADVS